MDAREDRLLTVGEVARYLRVENESVRRWLREGKMLGINLGRGPGWRIRLGDLESFIAERHSRPGEAPAEDAENGYPDDAEVPAAHQD